MEIRARPEPSEERLGLLIRVELANGKKPRRETARLFPFPMRESACDTSLSTADRLHPSIRPANGRRILNPLMRFKKMQPDTRTSLLALSIPPLSCYTLFDRPNTLIFISSQH
jgi:hypothetical protein